MIGLTEQWATKLVRGLRDTSTLPEDWVATADDINKLERVLTEVANRQRLLMGDSDIQNIVAECFRCDTKTHKLITEGFMICGKAYFADEADAVEWFNANGIDCATFDEGALAAEKQQWQQADWTYWNQWYSREYKYTRN